MDMKKKRIAIFASGSGTNAQKFFEFFQEHSAATIQLVLTNNASARVRARADAFDISSYVYPRKYWANGEEVFTLLKKEQIDYIVLAGFMLLLPPKLIQSFPNRIFNIHPALLPKYGGKGMYGMHVHRAVKVAGDQLSGITIHYVNEKYDEGQIIFQASCKIKDSDSAEEIAQKVLLLEHENYPKVVEEVILKSIKNS